MTAPVVSIAVAKEYKLTAGQVLTLGQAISGSSPAVGDTGLVADPGSGNVILIDWMHFGPGLVNTRPGQRCLVRLVDGSGAVLSDFYVVNPRANGSTVIPFGQALAGTTHKPVYMQVKVDAAGKYKIGVGYRSVSAT